MNAEQKFRSALNEKELKTTDAQLCTEDGCCFSIHQVRLANNSDFFKNLFSSEKKTFLISKISGKALCEILMYLYKEKAEVTESNIVDIMHASHELQLPTIIQHVQKSLTDFLTVKNCVQLYNFFIMKKLNIAQDIFRFIQFLFEKLLYSNSKLYELSIDMFILFISNLSLNISSEKCIWIAIKEYVGKDILNLQDQIPDLLKCLASKEVDENLASEIMTHEIVKCKNCIFSETLKLIKLKNTTLNNSEILQTYLAEKSSLHDYRVSSNIHIIIKFHPDYHGKETKGPEIYATYDEKCDLYRKIAELSKIFWVKASLLIEDNLYFYSTTEEQYGCYRFNLKENKFKPMNNCKRKYYNLSFVQVENILFLFGKENIGQINHIYNFEAYDQDSNTWSDGVPLINIQVASAVAIGNRIFVIGQKCNAREMMGHTYCTITKTWSEIPSPRVFCKKFNLHSYNGLIYIIGSHFTPSNSIEVLNPENLTWEVLPPFPDDDFEENNAVILNNELFIYSIKMPYKIFKWNENSKQWKWVSQVSDDELNNFRIFPIKEMNVKRTIWKDNKADSLNFIQCILKPITENNF